MRKTFRYVRFSLMLTVAILAAAIVSTLTVDVGSLLQAPAERKVLRINLRGLRRGPRCPQRQ